MDSSPGVAVNSHTDKGPGGGYVATVEKENCLKEIANNYVEEEDLDNSSSEERGETRENGHPAGVPVDTGSDDDVENTRDSANEVDKIEVSTGSTGEECSKETSERDEEDGPDAEEVGYMGSSLSRDTDIVETRFANNNTSRYEGSMDDELTGFVNPVNDGDPSEAQGITVATEKEQVGSVPEAEAGVGDDLKVEEKSLTENQGGRQSGNEGVMPGPTLRRRRGRPLKSNGGKTKIRTDPITPNLEEPRAVRCNRGIKRRFPGDESEDSIPKRVRVRSIASVCSDFSQPIKGEELSMEEDMTLVPARRRGRPRKTDRLQVSVKEDEAETPFSGGKRKMAESVVVSDELKRPCHGRNGPMFVCNAEGCKKRFVEASALYVHARVHGDRPYVCHYEGCIKSFSERSKLKRHFLIHTGEKPFLCLHEGCGKAFSLDFNLRSHMKTHTGDYHECPYDGCEKRYCQEYKLRAHIGKEHSKPFKATKKLAAVGSNAMGANGSSHRDACAAKKREMMVALQTKRTKLEALKERTASRISELEQEKQREASELARIEQGVKKLEQEERQLDGGVGSRTVSLSLSEEEDADDEGEEMAPSNETAGDTNSSGEQQSGLLNSPLEYMAMGEGRDVLMFAHKLPTGDQGARLVKSVEARALNSQQEPTTSLTPLLWLQGAPPHQGRLAQHPGLRPYLRSQRRVPSGPEASKLAKTSGANSSSGGNEKRITAGSWSQGESSDSGVGKSNGRITTGDLDVGLGKSRGRAVNNVVSAGRGTGNVTVSQMMTEKPICSTEVENGKHDHRLQKLAKEQTKVSKQQTPRQDALEDQVFVSMNPILLATDHGFSPTDARFLAQGSLRERLQMREGMKTACATQPSGLKEKVFRSMNEVLHSTDQGLLPCSGLSEGFGAEQAPSEQSFEPSAAQLFTYHEQPRLVD